MTRKCAAQTNKPNARSSRRRSSFASDTVLDDTRESCDEKERQHGRRRSEAPPKKADAKCQRAPRVHHAKREAGEAPKRRAGAEDDVPAEVPEQRPDRRAVGVAYRVDAKNIEPAEAKVHRDEPEDRRS